MKYPKYSALMSVYSKETCDNLKQSIDCVLNQTVKCDELVLVEDGPLSDELKRTWTIGKQNARLWAKKHGCDINGRLLSDIPSKDAVAIAERAEEIAIDTALKMSYYDRDKGRKTKWQNHS